MDNLRERCGPERIQVLIIGMLDSIHFARWLDQFANTEIDFLIVASKKYRKIHPNTISLLNSRLVASYQLANWSALKSISGYFDFLFFEFLSRLKFMPSRLKSLERILKKNNFQYLHALEIQGAGYLFDQVNINLRNNAKVIMTNWGSDIYYFMRFPVHERLIRSLLAKADFYSAECVRDYDLARKLGFTGTELPCIPNAGGFQIPPRDNGFVSPSLRNQIIIKGYGGEFGRSDIPISLIPIIASDYPQIQFHIYSATNDTIERLNTLPHELKSRIKVTTLRNRLTHDQMLYEFSKSRIYIGCSESDGISTSFIESLIQGAYPVQTNTSCANEWVARGSIASIVGLDSATILSEVRKALDDDHLVDMASEINFKVALEYLESEVVKKQALQFYK